MRSITRCGRPSGPTRRSIRAPDHAEAEGGAYGYDPAEAPQRMGKAGAHDTGTMGEFENMGARQSKTAAELNQPGAKRRRHGHWRHGTAVQGRPQHWRVRERRARERQAAEAEREKRFEARRAEAERMKAEFEARKNRAGQSDASGKYQTFGTKPHFDTDTGFHRTTQDGFVADVDGNPVVWPTQGAAAKWAARFKMGGDFELQAHGTSKRGGEQPVTLQRKPGSTYGEQVAPHEAASATPEEGAAPKQLAGPWERFSKAAANDDTEVSQPAGHGQPDVREGGDLSAAAEAPVHDDVFPGDLTPEQVRDRKAQRVFEQARPPEPGKEPRRPATFFSDVANHLAERSKKAGVSVRISAEDAINQGVPAEYIYHNPRDRYPTVKANAAKVFTSTKAPLKSRAKPVKTISLDDIGDRFQPEDYGVPSGDGVQAHRMAAEHSGDLLRRSMEGDYSARGHNDAHQEWMQRGDDLEAFEAKYGTDWRALTDEQLAELDPSSFDAFYDEVLQGAERPSVDPFDPRFWENEGERQAHPSEDRQSEVPGGGRDDLGGSERDAGEQAQREDGHEDGRERQPEPEQADAFGERAGDQRRSLERKGDAPLRGTKQQKAPGSDGGLFDDASHGKQGNLLKRLIDDESGALDLDALAKFFVDTDTVHDAKEGVKKLAAGLRGSSARDVLAKTLDSGRFAGRFVASYFHSIDARMRGLAARFDSPAIRELADMFHARAGLADGTARTYHEAIELKARRWNKTLFDTLHPFAGDEAAMTRIRNIITRTGRGSTEETAAAQTVAKMLKEIHDYRLDAGEDLGEVTDGYFPRILDADAVVKAGDEFRTIAAGLFEKAGVSKADAKAKADVWFHQVVNEHAGLDGSILDVRRAKAPGTTSGLPRTLDKDADRLLAKFYTKDPLDVLSSYVTGSAKRAEFTRRFGVPGRDGSKVRNDWIAKHGTKDQLDVIRQKIDDEILASGKEPGDAQSLINDMLEANLGILGKASTNFRLGISLAHGYNQIAKMDHSLITSFNELAMGLVRSGSLTEGLKFLGTTVKEFGRELLKMEPSEARRYAEHLGLILNPMMDQVLQSRISAVEGSRGINKLVSRFYRVIGLHQFTEAERIAAAKMAREHLNVLAGDLASKNARTARRAERALAELGVTDHAAFATFLKDRGGKVRFDEIDKDRDMAAKWSTAVARMTDQTVMNPTRAVKPLWANHPLGSLLYGLMSYTFAFKKNVLDRATRMAVRGVKEKDPALFAPLFIGLPALAAFTYLNDTYVRPTLFGSSYDFAHETAPMGVLRAVDRASIDGALSPLVNVMFGQKYSRSLSEGFLGSFAGSALQGVEKLVVKPIQAKVNGTEGNGAERGAAGALYDLFIEPAVDAAAVATVGGKVATGVVYASGSRPGSIFPQDREGFIDAMAGPQAKKASDDPFTGKSDFDSQFDKASGADAFDKAFK
jgi:hypothetical protein